MKTHAWVKAEDYGWLDVNEVEFIEVREDLNNDIMSFRYNDKEYTSIVIFGNKPE